ncbi:MAG: VPLPA-CTERM sorting domain-containing protein [Pseudomonadota bacterium]
MDTVLCAGVAPGTSPCELPGANFPSGSLTLFGNPGGDVLIVDNGQTALLTTASDYYNFGTIRNQGNLELGNASLAVVPWLRIMGPGSMLDNFGATDNLSTIYVQDNFTLSSGAPTGPGSIYNRSGAVFNNGLPDGVGGYLYGDIDGYDGATLTNDGTFNNYSLLYLDSTSVLINRGVLTNYAPGTTDGADMFIEGTVTNSGTIHNTAGAAMEISGTLHNAAGGRIVNDGRFDAFASGPGVGSFTNEGAVEISAGATGPAPVAFKPGRFLQTAGSLSVDGQFVQSKFDIQGGLVTGGGIIDTTNSDVVAGNPTVYIGPDAILLPGGVDNTLEIVGNVTIDGELIIQLAGIGQGTVLQITQDPFAGSNSGNLDFNGTLTVQLLSGFTPSSGDTFDLLDYVIAAGNITLGDFTLNPDANMPGFRWVLSGNTTFQLVAVPLPAGLWLFLSGLAAFAGLWRRQALATA